MRASQSSPGSAMGADPVAITTVLAWMRCGAGPSTATVLPSRNRARPSTMRTPARASSPATPPRSPATMPSFQPMMAARSTSGPPGAVRPGMAWPEAAARIIAASSPAWISALDGMHPTLRQVPPVGPASTTVTSTPARAAVSAQT